MHSEFEMSMMGELNFFLGLQIKKLKEGTFINQAKYIRDLLKMFNMEEGKTMKTPMSSSIKLDKDEKGKSVNSTMYRDMIVSLLYLTASRPDIMYSICLCARFQSCPKESHLSAIKRILRYLKGTMDIGLWYPKGDNFQFIGFSDADFAGCKVERKSTSGTCHFLGHSLVSWHSKKQNSVALSMAEAEYIAAGQEEDHKTRKCQKNGPLTVDQAVDRFVGARNLKRPPTLHFSHVLLYTLKTLHILASKNQFGQDLGPFAGFGVDFGMHLRLGALRASGWCLLSLVWFHSLFGLLFLPIPFVGWRLGERQLPSRLRASALLSHLSPNKLRLAERKVIPGRSINFSQFQHFGFEGLFNWMGWLLVMMIFEPIFPTLVWAFYSRVTYRLGGPVMSTVRGVEIRLSPESIYRILDIPLIGLRVYKAKAWPTMPGFELREAIQRLCRLVDDQRMGKPSAHSLTMSNRVLHHMICSILLPRGGHRDESTTRVLPYDRFLTRVFKDVEVNLNRETDFEAPTSYDTYNEQSLGRMKFEKAPDGSWIRRAERQRGPKLEIPPPPQSEGIHVEATFSKPMMTEPSYTARPSFQPSFTELPHTEIPFQAPHATDHAPWMDA
ncbi:Retrovirus-related Pol polyprotein from transposon RE1 [Vitis vinifera]|uniref:Retrovirus-related Pol polyprotein from transposon RE1 n=1 Tax=Vitis vinifera TaxID=29760 RepID=A0A438CZI1_VITVI|nr:Retrovirus-related Pol polyprotein from transposon RE1 [Vitis vinifera]